MAEKPISHEEIFEEKVLQPTIDQFNELNRVLNQTEAGLKAVASVLGKKIQAGVDPKTISEVEQLKIALDKLKQTEAGITEIKKAKIQVQEAEKKQTKEIRDEIKGQASAYAALQNELTKWRNTSKDLLALQAQGITLTAQQNATLQTAAKNTNTLDSQLKRIDDTLGVHNRHVGNYGNTLITTAKGVGGLTGLLGLLGKAFGIDTAQAQTLADVSHELIKGARELSHIKHLETLSHEENSVAIEAETVAQEESAAASTAALGPIGALLLGAVALGAAIWYMVGGKKADAEATAKQSQEVRDYIKELFNQTDAEKKLADQREADLESVGFTTVQSKEAQDDLNKSLNEEAKKLTEATDAQEKLNRTRKGGLDDLERELELLKAKSVQTEPEKLRNAKAIFDKEQEIRNAELQALNDRAKALGEFAFGDLELQKQIADKKNEIAVAQAERQKTLDDAAWEKLKQRAEDTRKALDDEIKYEISSLKGKDEAEKAIAIEEIQTKIRLGIATKEEIDALNEYELEEEKKKNEKLKAEAEDVRKAQDAEIKYEIEALSGKFGKIEQIIARQEIATKIALGIATPDEVAAYNADIKAAREKRIAEELDAAEKLDKAITEGLQQRNDFEKKINDDKLSELQKQIEFQQKLAIDGQANTLSELQKERAKALDEQRQLEIKAAKEKEAEQLAELFLENMKFYAKDGIAGVAKATAATIAERGLAKLIAGKFAKGVENFKGKGDGTSDSNLIGFSSGESVVTAQGTDETPGLVTAINKKGFDGAAQWAMKHIFPNVPVLQDKSISAQVNEKLNTMLLKEIKGMRGDLQNLPDIEFKENVIGEIVKIKSRQGVIEKTTYKEMPGSYAKR